MERRNFLALCAAGSLFTSSRARAAVQAESRPAAQPLIVTPQESHIYSLGLGEARILVDGERSKGSQWLGQFREDPGFMTALHFHHRTTEYFFILDGSLAVYLDGVWHDLGPGTTASIPAGTPHAQGNTSGQPAKFVSWGTPAGFELSFPEIDQLSKRVAPNSQEWGRELAKIITRHDTQVVGPPPHRG